MFSPFLGISLGSWKEKYKLYTSSHSLQTDHVILLKIVVIYSS